MSHLAVQLLALVGFCALALATERQQRSVFGRHLTRAAARGLRAASWSALMLALLLAIRDRSWTIGLVTYSGHTSLAAGLVFGALIGNERRRAPR